jgi:hypothetical protein
MSLCSEYSWLINIDDAGIVLLTNRNSACSGCNLILFLTTKSSWPTVKSSGTRYLILSSFGNLDLGAFSIITGTLSGYFCLTLVASLDLASNECLVLKLDIWMYIAYYRVTNNILYKEGQYQF